MIDKARLKLLLKLAVGLTLVALLLSRIEVAALVDALGSYTAGAFSAALALTAASMLIAGLRWKVLVPHIGYMRLLRFTLIGQFYSLVLPGQITGDAVKAWRISRGVPDGARTALSVLADRIAGLIALLLVCLAGIALSGDGLTRKLLPPVLVLTIGLIGSLLALQSSAVRNLLFALIDNLRRVRRGPPVAEKLSMLISSWTAATGDARALLLSVMLGVVFQLIGVAIYAILAACLSIDLDWTYWMWIAGVTAVALLLPVTLGGLGIREGTLVAILAHYGVPGEKAVALSLGLFALAVAVAITGWMVDVAELRASRTS